MLSLTQNVVILVTTMAISLGFMAILNHVWPYERRRHSNDLIGWQLSVLGTTYAVILGFMLYTVWTTFGAASLNSALEANALRNLYRLAEGLPEEPRLALRAETTAYADAVIKQDWPDMARGKLPEQSHHVNEDMWRTLMSIKVASSSESMAEDHALSELSDLTAHRRTRLLQSVFRLPIIFWSVLLVGAALTLVSVIMFGSASAKIHALQVFSLTLLITLAMLAITDVNEPFRGWIKVNNYAFQRARTSMHADQR
jgi:hypothetical protein